MDSNKKPVMISGRSINGIEETDSKNTEHENIEENLENRNTNELHSFTANANDIVVIDLDNEERKNSASSLETLCSNHLEARTSRNANSHEVDATHILGACSADYYTDTTSSYDTKTSNANSVEVKHFNELTSSPVVHTEVRCSPHKNKQSSNAGNEVAATHLLGACSHDFDASVVQFEQSNDTQPQLPPEVWEAILQFLHLSDLCRLCLVSSTMYKRAAHPCLWKTLIINRRLLQTRDPTPFLESCARLRCVEFLNLRYAKIDGWRWERFFEATYNHLKTIRRVDLTAANVAKVPEKSLANYVFCRREVIIDSMQRHFMTCTRSPDYEKTYHWQNASDNLKSREIKLSKSQLTIIFSRLQLVNMLEELNLSSHNLSHLPRDEIGKVVSSLNKLDLSYTRLNKFQLASLLENTSSLCELNIAHNNLSQVNREVVGSAVANIRVVDLSHACLYTNQLVSIFEHMTAPDSCSTLEELHLVYNHLENVPVKVFSQAIGLLKRAGLQYTCMNSSQISAVFEQILERRTLCDVNFEGNSVWNVDDDLLGQAVEVMVRVSLDSTELSTSQLNSVLEHALASSSMRELNLLNNPTDAKLVSEELRDRVAEKLPKFFCD